MNETEKTPEWQCEFCCFNTGNKKDFGRHLLTAKHLKNVKWYKKDIMKSPSPIIDVNICECGKKYKHNSGLWRHKKVCNFKMMEYNPEISKNDLIKQLLLQNQQLIFDNKEFKEMMFDQSNKMMELASKPTSVINNNSNSHNKQFNLNLFLNERCKNAMNMSDFIDSIKIEDDDFENIGKLGYVQGISNIFIKGLKNLDETLRPMHCNDIKRETLYIKDNDTWDKDDNKQKVRNAIAMIAHKNFKYIPVWREANPSSFDVTTKKNDLYMKIANQVTTAITPDDELGINKIIRNVANSVIIDKDNL
jgi:hypothetical protein